MDSSRFNLGMAAILAAMLWAGASAQSTSRCNTVIINLAPCLDYITGNETTPTSSCCTKLAGVVRTEPQCLCTVLNGGGPDLGVSINQTKALALPAACNIQTPSASKCNPSGGAPSSSPSGSPSVPNVTADGGSKAVPTGGLASSGSSLQIPFSVLFSALFIAAYLSVPSNGY